MGSQLALSADDLAWYANPTSSDPDLTIKQLASAVIEEAITDVRMLRENGVLIGTSINPEWLIGGRPTDTVSRKLKRKMFTYTHAREIEELLEFFTGRQLESWLEVGRFELTAAVIKERMQIS